MSNPSARATGITVSQYLGVDLDYATDTQLTMLMDMHMEVGNNGELLSLISYWCDMQAIKHITNMKVRLAKNNERQRLLQPRDVGDLPQEDNQMNHSVPKSSM